MEAYTLKIECNLVMNSAWNSMHYCTGLEAVREAFTSIWDIASEKGIQAAARVQSDCSNHAAFWLAFGLCSSLLLEGKAGACEEEAWIRASFLYRLLTGTDSLVSSSQKGPNLADRPIIIGVNVPALDESLEELNEWRGRYGLSPASL